MPEVETQPVLGTPLAVTDYAGAVAQAKHWASHRGKARTIAAANTHVVTLARHNAEFGDALKTFDLVLPDGMPLVWVMNRTLAVPLKDRVYGPTFMLHCLEATQGKEWRHMLMGGTEELLRTLQQKLLASFPALEVVETYAPPFGAWSADEDDRMIERISAAEPHFVWVGLGCPKQELWLARMKDRLPAATYSAVGAAFAFHAGRVRQAPAWMQNAGLEWLFRLAAEPRRLWRRYFVYNSLFLLYLARERIAR